MDVSDPQPKWTARLARLGSRLPTRAKIVGGTVQGIMSAVAALIAYLPTQPLGLREGFWASITAIAVAQSELGATRSSARDQFTGAVIGGVISVGLVAVAGEHLAVYAAAVVASMLTCWLVNVSSAARISGSTVTITLLVPHAGSAEVMMASRMLEVGWGVVVGVAVVWLVNKLPRP